MHHYKKERITGATSLSNQEWWFFSGNTESSSLVIGWKTENMGINLGQWVDRYGAGNLWNFFLIGYIFSMK